MTTLLEPLLETDMPADERLLDDAPMDDVPIEGGTTQTVTISIENLSPQKGTVLTPLWFGFHDGTFDTYDRG